MNLPATLNALLLLCAALSAASAAEASAVGTIAPAVITASSSSSSAPTMLIDGSGLVEADHGGFTHSANRWADAGAMWCSGGESEDKIGEIMLRLDLGRPYQITGLHLWNWNETGYTKRGVREFALSAGDNDQALADVGRFTLAEATGTDDDHGQELKLAKPVQARFLRLRVLSNHGDGQSGLSEIRVRVADPGKDSQVLEATPPFTSKYARTTYTPLAQGAALVGGENMRWPADAGIIDVSKPPYGAKGDGKTDDTAALQRALDDHPNAGAIIWLPNGLYRISGTLTWPKGTDGGQEHKNTILMGQSEAATVIRLDDQCPGFGERRKPKAMIWTGGDPAQRFSNAISHLTLDSGAGNPGCAALQFTANNQGGVEHVTIVSGDGQGVAGLHLGSCNENGPLLVQHVTVQGFDVGVLCATAINSQTLEHIRLRQQNRYGLQSHGETLAIRDLESRNEVPALHLKGGHSVLIDAKLVGIGASKPAGVVVTSGKLYARNIETTGCAQAIVCHIAGVPGAEGAKVAEWIGGAAVGLGDKPGKALDLPVQETPVAPWDALSDWQPVVVANAKPGEERDDTAAVQAAIDAGKTTVYFPRGHYRINGTVEVRGKVRRIIGCRAWIEAGRNGPMFRLGDEGSPMVWFEQISTGYGQQVSLEAGGARGVTVRHCLNWSCALSGTGPAFVEDVCCNPSIGWTLRGRSLWARQLNLENQGTHLVNDGGTVWILGFKTERGGTLIATSGGGRTEVLGGFSYTTTTGSLAPMFTLDASSKLNASFGEACYNQDPFRIIVRGPDASLKNDDPRWDSGFVMFR